MDIKEIRDFLLTKMNADDLLPTQKAISAPKILRNLRQLKENSIPAPIEVNKGVIIEGHHRYVAGKIFGLLPDIVPGVRTEATVVTDWKEVRVDDIDWDNPEKS